MRTAQRVCSGCNRGSALNALLPCVFCDFQKSQKIFQNSIAFVGRIDDSPWVATKKFSERLTRVVRRDEGYDDDRSESNR